MPNELSWRDQPQMLTRARVISEFTISTGDGNMMIEVRQIDHDDAFYVTGGTLFSSQTIKADDFRAVLNVIAMGARGVDAEPIELPEGCELVEREKETA